MIDEIALLGIVGTALITASATDHAMREGTDFDRFAHIAYWILFVVTIMRLYGKPKR